MNKKKFYVANGGKLKLKSENTMKKAPVIELD